MAWCRYLPLIWCLTDATSQGAFLQVQPFISSAYAIPKSAAPRLYGYFCILETSSGNPLYGSEHKE